jgi:hypothetical protein
MLRPKNALSHASAPPQIAPATAIGYTEAPRNR